MNTKLNIEGNVCVYYSNDPSTKRYTKNAQLYDAATVIQKLLRGSPDGKNWFVGGMYIEFDNTGSVVDPTPVFDLDEGLSYYNNLVAVADRDYLRVPLFGSSEGTSNSLLYPNNNIAVFSAQTSGTEGVHGTPFSDAVNSNVYGGALVVFREPNDPSQDLVFARFYLEPASQTPKIASSQITVTWSETFTIPE